MHSYSHPLRVIVLQCGDRNLNPVDIRMNIGLIKCMIYFNIDNNGNIVIFFAQKPAE